MSVQAAPVSETTSATPDGVMEPSGDDVVRAQMADLAERESEAGGAEHTWGNLVLVRADGSDGASYPLRGSMVRVGRRDVDLCLPEDRFLASHEFTIEREDGRVLLTPQPSSTNGTFVRIKDAVDLPDGAQIRIGQELLAIDLVDPAASVTPDEEETLPLGGTMAPGTWGFLRQIYATNGDARVFALVGSEVVLGRNDGPCTFPYDGYVSGTHAHLKWDGQYCTIEDLGSSNGTFVHLRAPIELCDGDHFLAGQHLFKFRG